LSNRRAGLKGPPSYARKIAEVIAGTTQKQSEEKERTELLAKRIAALAPVFTFVASIITTLLTYLAQVKK
jgi:hypothetical protein